MTENDTKIKLYRGMLRAQRWEQRLLRFIEDGRTSGFYHAGRGQEAVAAGGCLPLRDDDYLLYDHRGLGHSIVKGVPMQALFADFLGTVEGTTRGLGAGIVHIAWPEKGVLGQSGTLGGSFVIAAGAGLSIRYRESDQVVLCYFGEGAANRGTFHEAANAAALWNLPIIWLCENNGWAVSVAFADSTSVPNVADRASAYGMPGEVVDGMDAIAVHDAVKVAVARARAGDGPSLIEAKTYRFRGHYEGDNASYRTKEELDHWKSRDPIGTLERHLIESGTTPDELDAIGAEVDQEVETAAGKAELGELPPRERVFDGLYA